MVKTTGPLMFLALAVTACGAETQAPPPGPDPIGIDPMIEVPEDDGNVDEIGEEPAEEAEEEEPTDQWDEWSDDDGEGTFEVISAKMVGQLGSDLFQDEEARFVGSWYEDDYYSYSTLDLRTDLPGGKTVMVMLNLEGSFTDPVLAEGASFGLEDWGATETYASTVGCVGEEGVWEDFDQVADETDVTVTPSEDIPGAIEVSAIATWQDGGEAFDAKAVAVIIPRD